VCTVIVGVWEDGILVVIIIVGIGDVVEGVTDGNGMRDGDGMGGVGTEDVLLDGGCCSIIGIVVVVVVGDGVDILVVGIGGLLLLLVVVGEGVGVGGTVVVRMDGVCVGGIVIGTVGFGADVGAGSLVSNGD